MTMFPYNTAAFLLAGSALGAAFAIQWAGYEPCELCLRQRIPYYIGLPALGLALAGARLRLIGARIFLIFVAAALAAFVICLALSVHHVGVEQGFWDGPARCVTRSFDMSTLEAFAAQIGSTPMVSCNVPSFRLLGFSLAVWNMAVSASVLTLIATGFAVDRILKSPKDS